MFFPSHSKFRQSSRRLLPTMKSEVRNDMTTSGNLKILGHKNNCTWNTVWVELAQSEFYVGKNEYPSDRIERLYTLGNRTFVVVLNCSPTKRGRGLNATLDENVPSPHKNKVTLKFMASKGSDYLKWITKISKHVTVVRSKTESHIWRSKFMTRKTIRKDVAIEILKAKKNSKSRQRKNTPSVTLDSPQQQDMNTFKTSSPVSSATASPELSPAILRLDESTTRRGQSFSSTSTYNSPENTSSNTLHSKGWFVSKMTLYTDWILVEAVTEDEDSKTSSDESKAKIADVILLSSIRSIRRYTNEEEMMTASLLLTHECPRDDGRIVSYEFRASPGKQPLDHTLAWQGLLSCYAPRILSGGMPFRDLVVRVGSLILTGWLHRRVDGLLKNVWKRQWVVLDGNDRTLKCFESTDMRNCTFVLRLGRGTIITRGERLESFSGKPHGFMLHGDLMGMDTKPLRRGTKCLFCSRNAVENIAWIDSVLIACRSTDHERHVERVQHVPGDLERLCTMIRTTGVGKEFEKITSDCETEFCIWINRGSDLISNLIPKSKKIVKQNENDDEEGEEEDKMKHVTMKPKIMKNLFDERIGAFSNRKGIFKSQQYSIWNVHDRKRLTAIHFSVESPHDVADWTSKLKHIKKLDKSGVMNRVLRESLEDESAFEKLETLGPPPDDFDDLEDLGPPPPEDFEDDDDLPPPDLPPPEFPIEEKRDDDTNAPPDTSRIPVPPPTPHAPSTPSSGFFSVGSMLNVNEKLSCFPVSLAMMAYSTCDDDLNARLAIQQIQEAIHSGFHLSPEIVLSLMCTSMNNAVFSFLAKQIGHSKVFDESELVFYLPQIVQALRFEVLMKYQDPKVHNTGFYSNSTMSMSESSMRKISDVSIDDEDYLPAYMSRTMSSASSSVLFENSTTCSMLPTPLAMALITRSLTSPIVASKLMWLLSVEMVTDQSGLKDENCFNKDTFSKSFSMKKSQNSASPISSMNENSSRSSKKDLHPSVLKMLQKRDSPSIERLKSSSFSSEIKNTATTSESSVSIERRVQSYYAACHATLIDRISSVSKIEQSLHGQTILMDRLYVINRYISSSEGGKDTSAKGAELRRIVAKASKTRQRAESLLSERPESRHSSISQSLDAKMLVSPLYPKMHLTRVLPNACTVFKSALRPMLMRFEVKLGSTFSLHDLLADGSMTMSSITRDDCVATRVRKRLSQLVHSKPRSWIVQDLKDVMSKRRDSTRFNLNRNRWTAMIDAVCAQIVMTYITSESPVTENLWTQKQRAAVAKELNIDQEEAEHLFKFICAEANRRRHTSRFTLGSTNSNATTTSSKRSSLEKEDNNLEEDLETGGTRIGQIPLTLSSCQALGRGIIMCGPMWKTKPSIMGSGSQILRQVWLKPGYLAYTSGKIVDHKDDSVRLIELSDIDSVQVHKPETCQISISLKKTKDTDYVFSCANKLEAWTWTCAIRNAVSLANRRKDKDENQGLGGYRSMLHDASENGLTSGPSIWRHVKVSRRRVMGLEDPQNMSSIRFASILQGHSVNKFVNNRLEFHVRFKCDHATYSETEIPYSRLKNLDQKESHEFNFHFFDHHKRSKDGDAEDATQKLSLELWACSKSNTRKDPPLAFCLCNCSIRLSDIWNTGTKRFRCPMYVRPQWMLDQIQDILGDVEDSESLDGAWINIGPTMRSLDLPLKFGVKKKKERRRSSGMTLLRKALYDDEKKKKEEDSYLEDDAIKLLSHDCKWHGEIVINDKILKVSSSSSTNDLIRKIEKEIGDRVYDEIVKQHVDDVIPDTPEDNMAKRASSWASQSVREHIMGELCTELASLFQAVWIPDVTKSKSSGRFLIVSGQKKPRLVVTVRKSRVVVRTDARVHIVFDTGMSAASSREKRSSSSSTTSSSSSFSRSRRKSSSVNILTNTFGQAKARSRALNCCLASTFQLDEGLVTRALDRLRDAERKNSDASDSCVFSSNATNEVNQNRRVLAAVLLSGLVDYENDASDTWIRQVAERPEHQPEPFAESDSGYEMSSVIVELELTASQVDLQERMEDLLQIDNELESFGFIFKRGDDVRQDMLVLQLIKQMDIWLKQESSDLDLQLTIYGVLAANMEIGILEMVPGCCTLSGIKEKHGTILKFLQCCGHMDSSNDLGVDQGVLEVFARSCAGWAVASYVLGIGDRHFDNILVQDTGRLVHIDFGWAFGHDPKDFTGMKSPIRFNHDMLAVMGGREHKLFKMFIKLCCDAYLVIRSHAEELETLLYLMRFANIEHLGIGRGAERSVAKVKQNLKLWLTEKDARAHMEKLIYTCLKSKGQDRLETMHKVAMTLKS